MKKIIITTIAVVLTLSAWGQTRMSAVEQNQVFGKMDSLALKIKTMQCSFTQTKEMKMLKKEMVSGGNMYYKRSDKLCWQYTSPYNYTFILDNGKALIKSDNSTTSMDAKKNKIFRQISDIMINCITGGNLSNSSFFNVTLYKDGNVVYAQMQPLKKELKQMYSSVMLYFDSSLTMVTKVVMIERNGDSTVINMKNIKINSAINDKVFSIN